MTAPEVSLAPGEPTAPARRRWLWVIVGLLGLVTIGGLVWTFNQASELTSANDARDEARVALKRSRVALRYETNRHKGEMQSAISPSNVGHQIVDALDGELELAGQLVAASRQGIRAIAAQDDQQYNNSTDQLNAVVDQMNALIDKVQDLLQHLFAPAPAPSAPDDNSV